MPRVSARQEDLRQVRHQLELSIVLETSASSSDADSLYDVTVDSLHHNKIGFEDELSVEDQSLNYDSSSEAKTEGEEFDLTVDKPGDLAELYFLMYNTRYFLPRTVTSKSNEFATQFFHNLPNKLFRQLTRMDKDTFFHLLEAIEAHPIFQNESNLSQTPTVRQLAVCLDRLGHDGNGACLNHLIPTWGVSTGSCVNFSKRCFEALDSVLTDQVRWPNRDRRQEISDAFAAKGFPGCVGLIDGSLLPLTQRPAGHGECYYDRKSKYSMNAQVVCDHERKILFMFSGMPGSCCDLTCLKRSPLWQSCNIIGNNNLFDEGQYLLGDSGYQALPHVVCAFKRTDSAPEKEDFNICVVKCRVTNEHCIGVLKSRWHSLKEVRVQINSQKDSIWIVRWIGMCVKLHNYVITQNDLWTDADQALDAPEPTIQSCGEERRSNQRSSRRDTASASNALLVKVMDHAIQFHQHAGTFAGVANLGR